MCACCFFILVHISTVLSEPFLQALATLANVLLGSPSHPTGDGIADVGCVAVHGCGQVQLVVGGSGLKGWSSLDVGAGQAIFFSTFFHPWLDSSRSNRGG